MILGVDIKSSLIGETYYTEKAYVIKVAEDFLFLHELPGQNIFIPKNGNILSFKTEPAFENLIPKFIKYADENGVILNQVK